MLPSTPAALRPPHSGATPIIPSRASPLTDEDLDFISEIAADVDAPALHFIPRRSMVPLMAIITVADKPSSAGPVTDFRFPWSSVQGTVEQPELAELLEELVARINGGDGYQRHRMSFCTLSLAMNILGLKAPAFRPQPTIPKLASDQTPEHLLIQRDRIVIDCHWLYATKSKVYATEGTWRGMMNPKLALQMSRIEQFAATKLRNDSRADEILELNSFQQIQMAAMRGSKVQQAFQALREGKVDSTGHRTPARFRRITAKLQDWTDSQARFEKLYPKYRAYAMALELLEAPTTEQVAQMAGLILGEPPLSYTTAAQTLAKLKELTRHL